MKQQHQKPKPISTPLPNVTQGSRNELAGLNDLVNMMNDPEITGAVVPPGVETTATLVAPTATVTENVENVELPTDAEMAPLPPSPGVVSIHGVDDAVLPVAATPQQVLFFTGQLASGKDHCAGLIGARVVGFADPIYSIASYFFGVEVTATQNKQLPGMRAFLQLVGQWGRNVINEQYPVTPARALFVQNVRKLGEAGEFGNHFVAWDRFGSDENLWVDSGIARIRQASESLLAISNCRFPNEFKSLSGAGFKHYHCMCSAQTWAKRLAAMKLTPESPQVKDYSEQMATAISRKVLQTISKQARGGKLNVIWNDENVPPPSPRFFTLAEFVKANRQ